MTLATPGMRAVADTLLLFIYSFNIYLIFIFFFATCVCGPSTKTTRDKGPHIGWLNWNMTHIQTLDSVNMADFTIGCLSAQSRFSNKKTFVFQFGEHRINFWTNRKSSAVTGDQILSLLQSSECNTYHKSEYLHQWMKKRFIFTHNYEQTHVHIRGYEVDPFLFCCKLFSMKKRLILHKCISSWFVLMVTCLWNRMDVCPLRSITCCSFTF